MAASLNELYLTRALLSRRVFLPMRLVNSDIDRVLYQNVVNDLEGKCISEGFVQPKSVEVKQYSSGYCKGDLVVFDVSVTCLVFLPTKGMQLQCRVTNKTVAGLCAILELVDSQPAIIFVSKDHHLATNLESYEEIKTDDIITVECIGERFQLHDKQIHIIAVLTSNMPNMPNNTNTNSTNNTNNKEE